MQPVLGASRFASLRPHDGGAGEPFPDVFAAKIRRIRPEAEPAQISDAGKRPLRRLGIDTTARQRPHRAGLRVSTRPTLGAFCG